MVIKKASSRNKNIPPTPRTSTTGSTGKTVNWRNRNDPSVSQAVSQEPSLLDSWGESGSGKSIKEKTSSDERRILRTNSQAFDYEEVEEAKRRNVKRLSYLRNEGRNGKIWQMYAVMGMTQEAIATQMGLSQETISQIIKKCREQIPQQTKEEIIQERVEQLKAVANAMVPMALSGDPKSVAMLLKIQERESKLLGLDRPTKVETDSNVSYNIVGIDPKELT